MRAVLEGLAARYACEVMTREDIEGLGKHIVKMKEAMEGKDLSLFLRLDRDFHEIIWAHAQDHQLQYILRFLSMPYFAFVASFSTFVASDVRRIHKAHHEYVQILKSKNPDTVQKKVQGIHERLAVDVLKDLRRLQKRSSSQIFVDEEVR